MSIEGVFSVLRGSLACFLAKELEEMVNGFEANKARYFTKSTVWVGEVFFDGINADIGDFIFDRSAVSGFEARFEHAR